MTPTEKLIETYRYDAWSFADWGVQITNIIEQIEEEIRIIPGELTSTDIYCMGFRFIDAANLLRDAADKIEELEKRTVLLNNVASVAVGLLNYVVSLPDCAEKKILEDEVKKAIIKLGPMKTKSLEEITTMLEQT